MKKYDLTVFLPGRLDQIFSDLFGNIVTKVIWNQDENKHEQLIKNNAIDIAFEWQYGHQDHTVLDLVKKYYKNTKVILCLNWNGNLPGDYQKSGYFDFIDVPFNIDKLNDLFETVMKTST